MRIDYQTLRIEGAAEHVLLVTLNRPEVANAFNTQMGRDLLEFWTGMIAEPGKTRAVVLTGAGVPKELFTTLFATSRVAGWTAHVLESLSDLRIIRPASRWIGPQPGKKPLQLAKR